MTALVQINSPILPMPISLDLDRKVRSFASKLTAVGLGNEILAADAPTESERADLDSRAFVLAHWLQPADPEWVLKQVAALAAVRPSQGEDRTERKAALAVYVTTLEPLPQFALVRAFEAAHRGEVGNPAFMPSPAELHRAATRHVDPYLAERRKIESVLTATVRHFVSDPERRKAVADLARASIRAGAVDLDRGPGVRPPPETPEGALVRLQADKRPMPRLSPSARKATPTQPAIPDPLDNQGMAELRA